MAGLIQTDPSQTLQTAAALDDEVNQFVADLHRVHALASDPAATGMKGSVMGGNTTAAENLLHAGEQVRAKATENIQGIRDVTHAQAAEADDASAALSGIDTSLF